MGQPPLRLVGTHTILDEIRLWPHPHHPQSCSSPRTPWPPRQWGMGWWSLRSSRWVPVSQPLALSLQKGKGRGVKTTCSSLCQNPAGGCQILSLLSKGGPFKKEEKRKSKMDTHTPMTSLLCAVMTSGPWPVLRRAVPSCRNSRNGGKNTNPHSTPQQRP